MGELRSKRLSAVGCRLSARGVLTGCQLSVVSRQLSDRRAFTLVEMLVAMAITLVMMAAVVTLFANVSSSVANRRATVEMTTELRRMRNTLQQDLQGATCPGATWQRPESNHGYIELIEGIQNDQNPTALVRDTSNPPDGIPDESDIDPQQSTIPRNNVGADGAIDNIQDGEITAREIEAHYKKVGSFVPGGLGDHDDVLMLTVRNEQQPFVGRVPTNIRNGNRAVVFDTDDSPSSPTWGYNTIESSLAEVVWFCVENPATTREQDPDRFFGEPGIRTIYRRTFLIAPWVNPYSLKDNSGREQPFSTQTGGDFVAEPGLVRMLPSGITVPEAIAAIIAFQDKYDLSVRLEWDHNIQRWKIMANTLADLTKRENRFGHFGYDVALGQRIFPFAFMSTGRGYSGSADLTFVVDPELSGGSASWEATIVNTAAAGYAPKDPSIALASGTPFPARPFVFIEEEPNGGVCAVANATMDENGLVVRVTHGPAPLWGTRRGQDVMMTEVLGFDVRVFDPGAPLYGRRDTPGDPTSPLTVLQPSDPGWKLAFSPTMGTTSSSQFEFMGQGAYVDMGYTFGSAMPLTVPPNKSWSPSWFSQPRSLIDVYYDSRNDKTYSQMAPGYTVYDTWSFHYENNGVNEDQRRSDGSNWQVVDNATDEGTNGFDDLDFTTGQPINGADDVGERETIPPYDKPLRGVQVLVRTYEVDSRAIRQVRVNQHFLPE